jgi:ATP-dependent helicase/nuclease subunit A
LGQGADLETGALGKTIELLRAQAGQGISPVELAEALADLIERDVRHDAVPATAPAVSAVRVMNLHKVKGLEAPIVFLADPSGAHEHTVDIHVNRQGGRVRGYLAIRGEDEGFGRRKLLAHPADWPQHEAREKQFLAAENNRLLYVAATRAGAQLIVSQRAKGGEQSLWAAFSERIKECPSLIDPGPQSAPAPLATPAVDAVAATSNVASNWRRITMPTYEVRTARLLLPVAHARPILPRTAESERGIGWGAVIHLLLQRLMVSPTAELHAIAAAALTDHDLEPGLAALAVATAQRVSASELWLRAQAAPERLTETPFEMLWPGDGNVVPTLVRGVIDLAFREADGWVIADYKTDRASERQLEKLVETYRGQLEVYRAAWGQITRQPVKEAGLYFTHASRYVKVKP